MVLTTILVGFALVVFTTDWLPAEWDPKTPLDLRAPLTPVAKLKISHAMKDKRICVDALSRAGASIIEKPDFVDQNDQRCGIEQRVELQALPKAQIADLDMNCALALRFFLWDQEVVQKTARELFGASVSKYESFGTYNCREMRTSSGASGQMSKHASGKAIDISGFKLDDGRMISLVKDWDQEPYREFLTRVNSGACAYFPIVLGPRYNALHADHFHFDLSPWRACR